MARRPAHDRRLLRTSPLAMWLSGGNCIQRLSQGGQLRGSSQLQSIPGHSEVAASSAFFRVVFPRTLGETPACKLRCRRRHLLGDGRWEGGSVPGQVGLRVCAPGQQSQYSSRTSLETPARPASRRQEVRRAAPPPSAGGNLGRSRDVRKMHALL